MTDPQTDPVGFDDDEDLFAFDNLTAEASRKLSAELEAELDNALEEIEGDLDLARESSPNQGAEGAAAPALPAAASAPATPAAPAASPAPESSQGAPSPLSARVPELGALPPLPRRSPARRSYLTLHRTQLLLGLMVVINFNSDLGDAWEWAEDPYYPLEFSTYAYQMGVNFVIYSMTH